MKNGSVNELYRQVAKRFTRHDHLVCTVIGALRGVVAWLLGAERAVALFANVAVSSATMAIMPAERRRDKAGEVKCAELVFLPTAEYPVDPARNSFMDFPAGAHPAMLGTCSGQPGFPAVQLDNGEELEGIDKMLLTGLLSIQLSEKKGKRFFNPLLHHWSFSSQHLLYLRWRCIAHPIIYLNHWRMAHANSALMRLWG